MYIIILYYLYVPTCKNKLEIKLPFISESNKTTNTIIVYTNYYLFN